MCIRDSGSTIVKQLQDEVNDIRKRKGSTRNTGKCNENNNNEVVENEVSMYDTLSNGSDNESRKLVGVSNGVLVSVDELEKEWRESLKVECVQRADFPGEIGEAETSRVFKVYLICLLYTSRCV